MTRQTAIRLSYANAFLWAMGNGLVSTLLIVYLAIELGAEGLAISCVLASPRLGGVFRLGAPWLVAWLAPTGFGRKGICLSAYVASGIALVSVPVAAIAKGKLDFGWGISLLIATWCLFHLFEYVATITLWSWFGDIYPQRRRSYFLGFRERWLVLGRLIGHLLSFGIVSLWIYLEPTAEKWVPLTVSACLGAVMFIIAVIPLVMLPALASKPSATPKTPWRTIVHAFAEKPYRRLMAYTCVFGIANGMTSTVQSLYPNKVLGIVYENILVLRVGMRGGQAILAPWAGKMIARYGPKRIMLPAQLIVATGPLFFWFSTPEAKWWIVGAYAAWIAYAGINVGLDTLKLNLADPNNNVPYVAIYHSVSDLSNAVAILIGGVVYDWLAKAADQETGNEETLLAIYTAMFLLGWFARSLSAVGIVRLVETRSDHLAN